MNATTPTSTTSTKTKDLFEKMKREKAEAERLAATVAAPVPSPPSSGGTESDAPSMRFICAADVQPEPIEWLWGGWLAAGKLHILAGSGGAGKTTMALALAATVSTGGRWPDDTKCPGAGNVLMWSGEDAISDTLVPRLQVAGADCSRVHFLGDVLVGGEKRPFDPATDFPLIESELERVGGAKLVIVDPIVSGVTGDSHKNTETRRALQKFVDLGSRFGCAVLGITHVSKGTQGRDPTERLSGSIAFGAVARVVLMAAKRKDSEGEGDSRILVRTKSNIGPDDGGFGYNLEQGVQTAREGVFASRVTWGAPLVGAAHALIGEAETMPEEERVDGRRVRSQPAREWLANEVAISWKLWSEIVEKGKTDGFTEKQLRTAREGLELAHRREGFGGGTVWGFPDREEG